MVSLEDLIYIWVMSLCLISFTYLMHGIKCPYLESCRWLRRALVCVAINLASQVCARMGWMSIWILDKQFWEVLQGRALASCLYVRFYPTNPQDCSRVVHWYLIHCRKSLWNCARYWTLPLTCRHMSFICMSIHPSTNIF